MKNSLPQARRTPQCLRLFLVLSLLFVKAAEAQSASELQVRSFGPLPTFQIAPTGHSDNLNVFMSPTCNYCLRLLLDILEAYKSGDSDISGVSTTFSLMPRNSLDLTIISGLLCIPESQRARSLVGYYHNVYEINGRSAIKKDTALQAYNDTLSQFGVPDAKRESCEESEVNRAIAVNMYRLGDSKRTRDKMPLILYNDIELQVEDYRTLTRSMR